MAWEIQVALRKLVSMTVCVSSLSALFCLVSLSFSERSVFAASQKVVDGGLREVLQNIAFDQLQRC